MDCSIIPKAVTPDAEQHYMLHRIRDDTKLQSEQP